MLDMLTKYLTEKNMFNKELPEFMDDMT